MVTEISDTPKQEANDLDMSRESHFITQDGLSQLDLAWLTTKAAMALALSMGLTQSIYLGNTFIIGNMNDPTLLAGVGLGNALINVLTLSTAIGVIENSATYMSQSYGSGNLKECGIYLNKTKEVCTMITAIYGLIAIWLDKILIAAGQDEGTSKMAQHYCLWLVPSVWFGLMFECSVRFLSCQLLLRLPMFI